MKGGHEIRRIARHGPRLAASVAASVARPDRHTAVYLIAGLAASAAVLPLTGSHGPGFYYHDSRFLDGYDLRFAGEVI